jgi:dsDNA-binding SOS-regulon protein
MAYQQGLERRAQSLADAMKRRSDLFAEALRPSGQRPPFTKQLNQQDALKFWMAHRYDDLGARVLQGMQPADIAELDAALAEKVQQPPQMPGGTTNG